MINWFKRRFSEERLIRKVQKGDKEAFGKLYLIYLDRIYRYIFFRVNQEKHVAEDLTEIVFVKALEHIDKFSTDKGHFQAWLYKIAHNTVLDYYKSHKTQTRIEEHTVAVEVISKLEDEIDTKQKIEQVVKAMNKLTDEQRDVITLRFIEGLSHKQIAFITEKNEDAIRAIQYRGLQTLKKVLNTI